jgi:hypothetical protein
MRQTARHDMSCQPVASSARQRPAHAHDWTRNGHCAVTLPRGQDCRKRRVASPAQNISEPPKAAPITRLTTRRHQSQRAAPNACTRGEAPAFRRSPMRLRDVMSPRLPRPVEADLQGTGFRAVTEARSRSLRTRGRTRPHDPSWRRHHSVVPKSVPSAPRMFRKVAAAEAPNAVPRRIPQVAHADRHARDGRATRQGSRRTTPLRATWVARAS